MKKKIVDLTEPERIKTLDLLYTAAASIRGRDAMKLFLRDLLTESERVMLGRRIWVARLLMQGQTTEDIARDLKMSLRTVYRVQYWLKDQFPGYETTLKEMEKVMDTRAKLHEAKAEPFSYAALKKRFPLHSPLSTFP
ncbi:hypothetical protein K2P56_01315 [Patescibacteria group bacterium]|nr:hypothetical protein [Patescibacteria group bacterium]